MSVRTLPLLFLNLGGEMLYVLDQRLRAQNIPGDKARKGKRHPQPASLNALSVPIQTLSLALPNPPRAQLSCLRLHT